MLVPTKNFMANEGRRAADAGYHVMPCKPGEKLPGWWDDKRWHDMAGWQRYCAHAPSPTEIGTWETWPECGVSIACGTVLGLDIDIEDMKLANQIRAVAEKVLGITPLVRFGRRPRLMMVYRMAGDFRSRRVGPLDAMGNGRQFVAHGLHPLTKAPYEWESDTPGEVAVSSLPSVDEAKLTEFFNEAVALLPLAMRQTKARDNSGSPSALSGEAATREAVASAVQHLPPVSGCDYSYWVSIGMAIHSALEGDGMDLWDEWSQNDARYDGAAIEKKWQSFGQRNGVTAGTIFHEARRNGWSPEPGMFLTKRDAELAAQPHPAQALLDKIKAREFVVNVASEPEPEPELPGIPAAPAAPAPPPVSDVDWIAGLDGGLGMFVSNCVATAVREQPWLTLGAAIATFATAMGRRYIGPTGVRPNVYCLGVAPSSSGKDHPQRWAQGLLYEADCHLLVGGSNIASGAGMLSQIETHPVTIWVLDEVAGLIKASGERGAAQHLAQVNTLLLQLYSASASIYLGTDYANKKEKPRTAIVQPCASMFGCTTPSAFWDALQSGSALSGLLGRMLVFEAGDTPYPRDEMPATAFPDDLLEKIRGIRLGVPNHDHWPAGDAPLTRPNPYQVHWAAPEVAARWKQMGIDETDRMNSLRGRPEAALWGRNREQVQKLALIKAVARDHELPKITMADLDWASLVYERCMASLMQGVVEMVADNEYHADANKVGRFIRERTDESVMGATKSDIIRACKSIQKRRLDEILDQLEEGGQIRKQVTATAGRPRNNYFWEG